MPRGTLTKVEVKYQILKLMDNLYRENYAFESKELVKKYLNLLLDKLEEYAR